MYCWDDYKHETPQWFRDAKFGLFFHWGPYSVAEFGNEWYSRNIYDKGHEARAFHEKTFGSTNAFGYKDLIPEFTGEHFDPEQWAGLVQLAGAKYAGPVTEHGDNYSLWNSQINPVNSVKTGPCRDVVGECFDAFRTRGIRCLATFHHQWLWGWFMGNDMEADVYLPENELYYGKILPLETGRYIPNMLPDREFCQQWRDKVLEVLWKYSPDAVYFDSRANIIPDMYKQQICEALYQRADTAITYKQFDFPEGTAVVDIENGRFAECKPFPWQTDDRLEELPTWSYVKDPKYKSAERIIHQLIDIVAKNGNLLLNVGPKYDGTFHSSAVAVLKEIGDWLRLCGEAIYGTRPWCVAAEGPTVMRDNNYDIKKINNQIELGYMMESSMESFSAQDIRFTQKDGAVYAMALGWPSDGRLVVRSLGTGSGLKTVTSVRLLGCGCPVEWVQAADGLYVRLPETQLYAHACALKVE